MAFMEYLAQSGNSPEHITNHIIAVGSLCLIYGNTLPFRDQRIPLFIKSLKLNRSFVPKVSIVLDHTLLLQIITASAQLPFPEVYRALYLLAFFSFHRLSNIILHLINDFDQTKHLCVGDVIFLMRELLC